MIIPQAILHTSPQRLSTCVHESVHAPTHGIKGAAVPVACLIMPAKRRAKRGTHALAVPCENSSLGGLSILDEGTLVEVLRAALPAKVLSALASSSRQLCSLARSGVPVRLRAISTAWLQLVLQSHARGRPPFSGCTELQLFAGSPVDAILAGGVLSTAQHWTALQRLELDVRNIHQQQPGPGQYMDLCVSALLSPIVALQQLRTLEVWCIELGPCSAGTIGQLVQLTRLDLYPDAAAAAAGPVTRLDLGSWSGLTNLKHLTLSNVAAVKPAAGPAGPFGLPSSLTSLSWQYEYDPSPDALACWVTHLPGCPQLQEVEVDYGPLQHASTHPRALVRILAQHSPRLRQLQLFYDHHDSTVWGAAVAGLPDAAGAVEGEWHPGPALAALNGLEVLEVAEMFSVREEPHWQDLAQLTALTRLSFAAFHYAPALPAGACLSVVQLERCYANLGGHGLGRLLLACPQLETAFVTIAAPLVSAAVGPCEGQLQPHPRLKTLQLHKCQSWGSAAAAAAAIAAGPPPPPPAAAAAAAASATAQFHALAPVLSGVSHLELHGWPAGSSSNSPAVGTLPDLSPCTAVTKLMFRGHHGDSVRSQPEQEQFLSMLGPLVQLQRLEVWEAARLNARVALVLQSMLPQVQCVKLVRCGWLLPDAYTDHSQEQRALSSVRQLLRPGLEVDVVD